MIEFKIQLGKDLVKGYDRDILEKYLQGYLFKAILFKCNIKCLIMW